MLRHYSQILLEAKVEAEPLPEELYFKTPLQRAVQLFKRYRDIYFENKENEVSSIVITTLVASLYQQESSIFETIDNVARRSEEHTSELQSRGQIVCRLLLEKK